MFRFPNRRLAPRTIRPGLSAARSAASAEFRARSGYLHRRPRPVILSYDKCGICLHTFSPCARHDDIESATFYGDILVTGDSLGGVAVGSSGLSVAGIDDGVPRLVSRVPKVVVVVVNTLNHEEALRPSDTALLVFPGQGLWDSMCVARPYIRSQRDARNV